MSFIDGYLFEVNEFPKHGKENNLHTIKDYFYHNSETDVYGARSLVVPVPCVANPLPPEDVIRELIKNQVPVLKYSNKQWSFEYDPVLQ
jgi:hypothetical protein